MDTNKETVSLIHDEFGKEEFLVSNAAYNLREVSASLWEFTLYFETTEAITRAPGLEEAISDPEPNFEATALLEKSATSLFEGKIIEQAESWDYDREENLSNVYYFEHAGLEKLRVEIVAYESEFIKAKISGRTLINGSNGNEPDASVQTSTITFKKDTSLERGVM